MENLSLKSPEPDSFRDGHRALEKAIPSAQWYSKPKWLDHRCRTYAKTHRRSWTNRQGKVYFYQKWPERYIRQEFAELIYSAKPWGSLFDHWGRLTLADGRVALFSSPYVDDYATALAFAEATNHHQLEPHEANSITTSATNAASNQARPHDRDRARPVLPEARQSH